METNIQLSKRQQAIIKRAAKLLHPFNKEDVSCWTYYFEDQDEEGNPLNKLDFSEYDCCDNDKCIQDTLSELRKKYPKSIIESVQWANNGDHERIDNCYQCGRPLNSQLTWIRQELEHHECYSITKRDLKHSRTAFDVICLLDAMPSADERISSYAIHQATYCGNSEPLFEQKKQQKEFVMRVVSYATLIIEKLKH